MAIDNIDATDNLNQGRLKLNAAIDQANTVQGQLDTLIINNGQSDAEVIQGRGTFPLLYNRLDASDALQAQTTKKVDKVPDEYDVFVIYGQSNAFGFAGNTPGRGTIPDYSLYLKQRVGVSLNPIEYNMEYIVPGSVNSDGHAWVEFAREYRERTGRGLIFIPAAMGGKSIAELSKGAVGGYYENIIVACNNVIAQATTLGYTIRKWMMLFHQGENDQQLLTTRNAYQTLFQTLWADLKFDTPITQAYMFKVGNPQSRTEVSWYEVQVAQEYLCQKTYDVAMAYDACSSFTISNGMLMADGTHYTQKGYNLMGKEGAKNVAVNEDIQSSSTLTETKKYSGLQLTGDQIYRKIACTLYHDGTNFILKSIDDGGIYRSVFVKSITVDTNQVLVNLSCNIGDIVELNTQINSVGMAKNIRTTLTKKTDIDKLSVEFFGDITAYVDTATGAISYPPNGVGTDTGILGDLSALIDVGITKLSYKGCENPPIITQHTSSALSEFIAIATKTVGSTEVWFKYATVPVNDKRALVTLLNKKIDPSLLKLAGLEINVSAIVAERSR